MSHHRPPFGVSMKQRSCFSLPVFLRRLAVVKVEGGSPALHAALENLRREIHSIPNEPLSSYGTLLSRAIGLLARSRQKQHFRTSSMLLVALNSVLARVGCLSKSHLRRMIAKLEKLERTVEVVELELAVAA